jgi:hypothetical protein
MPAKGGRYWGAFSFLKANVVGSAIVRVATF